MNHNHLGNAEQEIRLKCNQNLGVNVGMLAITIVNKNLTYMYILYLYLKHCYSVSSKFTCSKPYRYMIVTDFHLYSKVRRQLLDCNPNQSAKQ